MTAPRIFFLHNPKAGGSSLRSVFAALNNTGSIAPVFGNAPADYQSNREFVNNYRGYDLYAGHYGTIYKIGRASCRERVCQYVSISVVAVSLKKKKKKKKNT